MSIRGPETHDNKEEIGMAQLFLFFGQHGVPIKKDIRLNVNKSPRDIMGATKDNVYNR
jgi:hypothetical protein